MCFQLTNGVPIIIRSGINAPACERDRFAALGTSLQNLIQRAFPFLPVELQFLALLLGVVCLEAIDGIDEYLGGDI